MYDESYYKTGNYIDYLQRKDRYAKLAENVLDHLNKMNLNKNPILDFGCAIGLLMDNLNEVGYEVDGVDISEWALEQCRAKNLNVSTTPNYEKQYGITFALDVLEHLTEEQLSTFVNKIQTKVLVFRMPTVEEGDTDYYLSVARRDKTHIIKWTKNEWRTFFKENGYLPIDLNLPSIYCALGGYSGIAIKV